jgi:beta-lactam-binding protein with PASTA domain/predicted Ser/Thr protein kinase
MVEPDTIVDGRYRVISRLGSGGMADVYLAEDQLLGRLLAVKLLHRHFAEDDEFVERFKREASSAAALSHPNIVGIFDRGEWQGTYYIAMEYVAGRSLKMLLREQGALDAASAIDIVIQILRAARFAHGRGVVHRDLKPHNVILDEEGRARVTDFGIARAGASDVTLTGSIMGTAQYLSPEQAQGHPVSASADLYSIGVILYELLTGTVPFEGETAIAIAYKHLAAAPRPPSEAAPSIPPALDRIVLKALAKDPAERFADAEEFISVLTRERATLGVSSTPALVGEAVGAGSPRGPIASAALPDSSPPGAPAQHGALLMAPAEARRSQAERAGRRERARTILLWTAPAIAIAAAVALALLLTGSSRRVVVPGVVGLSEQAAIVSLHNAGLTAVPSLAPSTTVASGVVASQSPAGGTKAARSTRVSIVISRGPAFAALPVLERMSSAEALDALRKLGLVPTVRTEPSATIAPGRVTGTDPPAGTAQQVGSPVTVLVSSGPRQVSVPDVKGDSQTAAEAALSNAGLQPGTITQRVSSAAAPGTVLSQSPRPGALARSGAKVSLVVAQEPTTVTVPSLVSQSETAAAAALGGVGLRPRVRTQTTTEAAQAGVVLAQTPAAGTAVRKGSSVTITIGVLKQATTPTTTTPTTTTPTTPTTTTPTTPAGAGGTKGG